MVEISKKDDFSDLVSLLNTNRNKENPQPFEYIIIKDREYGSGPSLADTVNLDLSESWYIIISTDNYLIL